MVIIIGMVVFIKYSQTLINSFLLEKHPNARNSQKELAPWNEEVRRMFARKNGVKY